MNYTKCLLQFAIFLILCNSIMAQVPVVKEPHHKLVLANNYVRLLDVHISPGDTTMYHIHAAPSVMVHISKSIIGSQIMGEAATEPSEVVPGQTRFAAYNEKPITHRVYNAGKNVFHVMDIELAKKAPSPDSCAALQQENIETTINEKLVRVYKYNLNAYQSSNIIKSSCAYLVVCISGEINTSNKNLKTGDYAFFKPNSEISIRNRQPDNSVCVILQLK